MLLVERPSSRLEPLLARLLSREESTEERTLSLLSGALTETLEAFFLLPRRALLRTLLRPRVDGAGETSLASPSMGGGSDGWWAVIQWSMVARELKKTREATREGQERYKRCIGMVMKVDASGKPMRERLSSTQANDAAHPILPPVNKEVRAARRTVNWTLSMGLLLLMSDELIGSIPLHDSDPVRLGASIPRESYRRMGILLRFPTLTEVLLSLI